MTAFDYRLNPLYAIKECSSCGALYTSDYCCSKEGIIDKIIRELPSHNCARCGTPVDDLQVTSKSSDENTNVVNAPQEPFVVKQDPDNALASLVGKKVEVPIRRSAKIPQAPDRYGYYINVEEYELEDLNEPPNYKATLENPESNKWLEAMNTKM
ncbi:hypothetical protein Tco_0674727 [Tanacetum coccineum]